MSKGQQGVLLCFCPSGFGFGHAEGEEADQVCRIRCHLAPDGVPISGAGDELQVEGHTVCIHQGVLGMRLSIPVIGIAISIRVDSTSVVIDHGPFGCARTVTQVVYTVAIGIHGSEQGRIRRCITVGRRRHFLAQFAQADADPEESRREGVAGQDRPALLSVRICRSSPNHPPNPKRVRTRTHVHPNANLGWDGEAPLMGKNTAFNVQLS